MRRYRQTRKGLKRCPNSVAGRQGPLLRGIPPRFSGSVAHHIYMVCVSFAACTTLPSPTITTARPSQCISTLHFITHSHLNQTCLLFVPPPSTPVTPSPPSFASPRLRRAPSSPHSLLQTSHRRRPPHQLHLQSRPTIHPRSTSSRSLTPLSVPILSLLAHTPSRHLMTISHPLRLPSPERT